VTPEQITLVQSSFERLGPPLRQLTGVSRDQTASESHLIPNDPG
jgi:hypothetical protein